MGDADHISRQLEDLLRPIARAAQSVYVKEQQADVVGDLIKTLTSRAFDATERAGKAEGYNQKLQEELQRQLKVQERFASLVAWYEKKTQIVVGGEVSANLYDDGPHAYGIRCDRCHRQVEEVHIVDHLIKHVQDEEREREIQMRADQMRTEKEMTAPPRKRAPRKKKAAAPELHTSNLPHQK